ncbi:MAG: DUF5692 family protein [Oscillospiraceae bacterium]
MTLPSTGVLILSIVVYTLVVFGLTELFRRYRKVAFVFIILSLFTFPLWGEHRDSWFEWAKILSVLIPTALLGFMRLAEMGDYKGKFWAFFQKKWALWFLFGILFLNIMEASIRDLQLGNYFNTITGFVLCVTIPFANKFWRFNKMEKGELIVDFNWMWCILYTTWNACFLLGSIPDEFAGGLAILIAAEFYSFGKRPDLYIMGRVYTLALFVLQLGIFDVFPFMDSSAWFNADVVKWWGIINFVLAALYLPYYIWQMRSGKGEKTFRNKHSYPEYDKLA